MPHLAPAIVYADDAIVVADKPSGLLSQPARGEERKDCLELRVQAQYPDALLVHRLDMATSGLILLARGPEMLRRMNHAFAQRTVGKRYVAAVHGLIATDRGEIDLPLAADPDNNPRQMVDRERGRRALTRYRVLARSGAGDAGMSRVELEPVTGRTHQLRVHLAAIGHPILGDALYGGRESRRMMLHACRVEFAHPLTGQALEFNCAAPF